ncbi:autotransporter domain-containing protein [Erythrobacter insulae]|uniref:Autotransporter domain-containing protein n=1 Tax=Erythrobacter insulae TaxID=2584124 RepID=A0A547P8I6_9SPHN|nr:autotransporter domain-containing protein [Erythrobacter insulae]TRD10413.1 autotransporter domain-containing protein [Erythrobacter insulae]
MGRLKYLMSVGVIGLAGGLSAAPALANDTDEEETETIALEARGTFEGIRIEARLSDLALPELGELPDFRIARNLDAVPVPPTPEILSRDDVGLSGSVDVNNTQPSVVQMFIQNNLTGGVFFNCTGSVINARTIMTAAHCLNSSSSESYGTPGAADQAVLISTGVDSSTRLFEYLGSGANYAEGGVATSTDVIIHPSSNLDEGGLPFPWADIALIAVDTPITDVPALPILLTPLTELTHVVQVGYGTFGTASDGNQGIGFLRRVGENMLGALASPSDLGDAFFSAFAPTANFGFETQAFYFTDFDNPDRTQAQIDGCTFTPFGASCVDLDAVRAIDYFDDDALPNEVATAGGDSGSPLIADELYAFPIAVGVLSGGFDFFGVPEGYGDISFYNPLYPFFEFITQNTPYKYVSAVEGDGVWSDPTHWTQDLDPGFFVDDGTGTLVNGIPAGSEPGVYEAGPKLGTILGIDISEFPTDPSPFLPPEGTPNFGGELPTSSVLLGPGSTGFVPQNTDGTPGISFANPAQYFDVILNRAGTTTVDLDVEVDKLSLDNGDARFVLPEEYSFTSLIGYEQLNGRAQFDGTLNAGTVALFGGIASGTGTVRTDAFFNLAGAVAPGGLDEIGTLTIEGPYIQTAAAALLTNAKFRGKNITSDLLSIVGDASLGGGLLIDAIGRPQFGSRYIVLSADSIVGNFDQVVLNAPSPVLIASTRVDGGNVIVEIDALPLSLMFNRSSRNPSRNLSSVGGALDTLRFGGRYAEFAGLFDIIDNTGFNTLIPTLSSLTPYNAFNQSAIANSFSQRFTGQLGQRTLSLRGASKGAAGFSAGGNAAFAIAETNPQDTGKLGFFSTASGVFLVSAEERSSGNNALEEAAFTQAGELTVGTDVRVSDTLSFGFAMTNIRNSGGNTGTRQRLDDTSVSGAFYGAAQSGKAFADMYVGFSDQTFGVQRQSQGDFALAYANAQASAEGSQTFAGLRLGYAFDVAPGLEVGPVASVDYVQSDIGGYDEFGAGQFGLSIRDRSFTSAGGKIGLMGALETGLGRSGSLSAFGSVAYARELADTQDVVTANFFGAADVPFSIFNDLDAQWVSVNAGAEMAFANRMSVSVSATSDLGRGVLTNNQGRVSLNWRF